MIEKKILAAEIIANGGTGAHAARTAGVDRSTVTRWVRDPEFQRLILDAQESATTGDVSEEATKSLSDLLPQAVAVIEKALSGDKTLVSSARVALDVMKTAAQLSPKKSGNDTPPLADLISELDKRDKALN